MMTGAVLDVWRSRIQRLGRCRGWELTEMEAWRERERERERARPGQASPTLMWSSTKAHEGHQVNEEQPERPDYSSFHDISLGSLVRPRRPRN